MHLATALLVFLIAISFPARAAIRVIDDTNEAVTLDTAARRIVSLAPNLTELLFSAGAGAHIIATVDYSDHPSPARSIPRIGQSGSINIESVLVLKPDLIVAWASGNPRQAVARLRQVGLPVYLAQPRRLEDIARTLRQLGRLAATEATADAQAERFMARYRALSARYAGRSPVRVFYQVLDPQLITVNGNHLISEILRLCGGLNVFATLPVLAPVVNEEAVFKVDPQAIIAGGTDSDWSAWQMHWRDRSTITAVKRNALYRIPADLIHRDTLRVLDGAEQVCEAIEDARNHLRD